MAQTDPNTGLQMPPLPPEYAGEAEDAMRRRLMAMAILQRIQEGQKGGTEMLGPIAVAKSPFAGIADSIASALANHQIAGADTSLRNTQQRFLNDQSAAIAKMQGLPTLDEQINEGQRSNFPRAQEIAKALAQQRGKLNDTFVGQLTQVAPETAGMVARTGVVPPNFSLPKPADPIFGEFKDSAGQVHPYGVNTNLKGEKKVDFASGTTVNIDQTREKSAAAAAGADVPTLFKEANTNVQTGQEAFIAGQRTIRLLQEPGVITGFAAGAQLGLASLGAKLGFSGADAVTKTQTFLSQIAKATLAASTQLKGSISDKEKPFLEAASAGSIEYTADALKHLANLAMERGFNAFQHGVRTWEKVKGANPTNAEISGQYPLPPVHFTADELLKNPAFEVAPNDARVTYNPSYKYEAPMPQLPEIDPNKVYKLDDLPAGVRERVLKALQNGGK